jgi:hypothetical protein
MDAWERPEHTHLPPEVIADDAPRRHDGFEGKRRRVFLAALTKTGCVRDAARAAGISPATVYNHQARDPDFARRCQVALDMAGSDIELHAWERGVVGIEEDVIAYGKVVGTRIKRSDMILKLLLQGCKPKKYGPRPGFTRKRLATAYRQEIEREVRDEWRRRNTSEPAEIIEALTERIAVIHEREDRKKIDAGWVRYGKDWIPPGWTWTGEGEPPAPIDWDDEDVPESM